jgi:hypothetical protein
LQNPAAIAAAAAAAAQQQTAPKAASPAQRTPTANKDGAQPAKRRGRPPGTKNRLCKLYGNPMVPQVVMVAAGEVCGMTAWSHQRTLQVATADGCVFCWYSCSDWIV